MPLSIDTAFYIIALILAIALNALDRNHTASNAPSLMWIVAAMKSAPATSTS